VWRDSSEIRGDEDRFLTAIDRSAVLDGLNEQVDVAFVDTGAEVRREAQSREIHHCMAR
jgi:hypothetical protein